MGVPQPVAGPALVGSVMGHRVVQRSVETCRQAESSQAPGLSTSVSLSRNRSNGDFTPYLPSVRSSAVSDGAGTFDMMEQRCPCHVISSRVFHPRRSYSASWPCVKRYSLGTPWP